MIVPFAGIATVRVNCWTANVAPTPRFAVIVTEHAPLPVQLPLHAASSYPALGVATSGTTVP